MMSFTLLSIVTALLVVTSTSTVYSVLWLVSTFLIISALLGFLNLGFTALLYIIVYVGAIAILFLFVVQLLDLGSVSEQPTGDSSLIQGINATDNRSASQVTDGLHPKGMSLNRPHWYTNVPNVLAIVISLALLSIIVAAGAINTDSLESGTASMLTGNMQSLFYNGAFMVNGNIDINSLLATKVEVANSTLLSSTSIVTSIQGNTPQVQSIAQWFYGPGLLPLVIISIILLVAMIAPISLCKDNE